MEGISKILQTRADFDSALELARAGKAARHVVASHFAGLVESAHRYAFDRDLAADEAPAGGLPDYCVIESTDLDPVRRQLKREVDPLARIFALGYTLAEVEAIVTELGGV